MHHIVYDDQTFALQRHGGISRYFCELASRVQQSPGLYTHVVAPLHFNDYLRRCEVPKTALYLPLEGEIPRRLLREASQRISPLLIRARSPSLIHRTYYSPRAKCSLPTVVTVFDMIHELFPEHFLPNDPTSGNKRNAVKSATQIVCISENTAQDLMRIFDVPAEKIAVTHLGFSHTFAAGPTSEDRPHACPYLLYVGERGGYKNFEGALRAFAASARLRGEFDLLVFGGLPLTDGELTLMTELGLRRDKVRRLTGSDVELARAYRHAHAFVYPSKYEGFGIPPLEAMSCGCPVVCSNTSSVPEVVGDAAWLFDPHRVDSIREALERVCFDKELRRALIDAGRGRASHFTWDQCAHQTIDIYRRAIGN